MAERQHMCHLNPVHAIGHRVAMVLPAEWHQDVSLRHVLELVVQFQ
jgi:hypothetical protein